MVQITSLSLRTALRRTASSARSFFPLSPNFRSFFLCMQIGSCLEILSLGIFSLRVYFSWLRVFSLYHSSQQMEKSSRGISGVASCSAGTLKCARFRPRAVVCVPADQNTTRRPIEREKKTREDSQREKKRHEKIPRVEKKERKWEREMEKKREILGLPTLRAPTLRKAPPRS